MARKKVSTSGDMNMDIPDLQENEEVVIEDKRTIRKQRAKPPAIEPEPIEFDDDDMDDDVIDAEPEFSQTSLAALIFGDDANRPTEQFCTVAVRRKPDAMRDRFTTPCSSVTNYPALTNISIDAERDEIEEIVREQYGGGHYFFQIRYNNRLASSWQSTLADLPAMMQPKQEHAAVTAAIPPPAVPSDPLDSMLTNLTKMKALKDALFGDEENRLKEQIADLKAEIANRPEPTPAEPLPENLRILEKALGVQNKDLQDRLLDAAFPEESGGHWIPETIKTIFEHKEEIGGILAGVLGGLAGPRPAASPAAMADMLRRQPPAALPPHSQPAAASPFKRGVKRSDTGETDDDGPAGEIEAGTALNDESNSEATTKDADNEQ